MSNPLLLRKLPSELAERSQVIEYVGKVSDFARLAEILAKELAGQSKSHPQRDWLAAAVVARLEFGWAEAGQDVPLVNGMVAAQLTALCQRCLEAFELQVETSFRMLITANSAGLHAEQGDSADHDDVEIWELEQETLRPLDLVEETLIMAMPLAPMHASRDDCGPLAGAIPTADDEPAAIRPFADLRSLLGSRSK